MYERHRFGGPGHIRPVSNSAAANAEGAHLLASRPDEGGAESGRRSEPRLTPVDFEVALQRMKRDLALTSLRRSLKDPTLDATAVLGIVRQIMAIQEEEEAAGKPPPAPKPWNITARCIPVPLM